MNKGGDQLDLLLVPLGEVFNDRFLISLHVEAGQPPGQLLVNPSGGIVMQVGEVGNLLFDGHIHVQSPFFGQKAEAIEEVFVDGGAVKGYLPRVGGQKV